MLRYCRQCAGAFEMTTEDYAFYERVSPVFGGAKCLIPPPTLCPLCRHQQRLAFRNERHLYSRVSDLSGKTILSIYSPDKPYKVYDQDEWWSDRWDAQAYGREFDFGRHFAEQFRELYEQVPRMALHVTNAENSYYTCYTLNLKNCYLLFGAGNDEDCMYGKYIAYSKDCVDSLALYSCEFCYEGTGSDGCYGCRFFTNCRNVSECTVVEDLVGCTHCICCFGLRNKHYYYLNEYVGQEKFQELLEEYRSLTPEKIAFLQGKLAELSAQLPHPPAHIFSSEGCSGEGIFNCKNCVSCFDVKDCEECAFLYNSPKSVQSRDGVYSAPDGVQYCYNICSTVGSNLMATFFVWHCDGVYYSMDCHNSRDLFGCVGLKSARYCIFNQQYSREEYEVLVKRIIDHMRSTGEWGEYLPYLCAPCAYNETVAQEYFPLSRDEAMKLGVRWHEESTQVLPAEGELSKEVMRCEVSGAQYKILPSELAFYKKAGLPIPRRSPKQRHFDRLKLHGSVRTYPHTCQKCSKEIESIYPQSSGTIVYCEECYLAYCY